MNEVANCITALGVLAQGIGEVRRSLSRKAPSLPIAHGQPATFTGISRGFPIGATFDDPAPVVS